MSLTDRISGLPDEELLMMVNKKPEEYTEYGGK